jgi:hypothetical protein
VLLDLLHHHHHAHRVLGSESSNAPSKQRTHTEQIQKLKRASEYNQFKLRLQQDDQLATDFIVALVTKGFFNVH